MIEYRMPIPARAYNTAVGGHVCGPEDIDFGQKVIHLIKYDRNGNEVSFESQVTQANKIYVIHDDFTLSSNVTIPSNSVLEFDGGSVNCSNYVITGNKMPTNVVYTPEQFGAGKTSDDTKAIQSCVNLAKNVRMDGRYSVYIAVTYTPKGGYCISVPSNTDILMNGTITYLTTDVIDYCIFDVNNVHDVCIHGNGKYVGDRLIHEGDGGEWGSAIYIQQSHDITIDGGEIVDFWGDGLYCGYVNDAQNPLTTCNYNITIKNLYIHDYRRQGISICGGHHFVVQDCVIKDQHSESVGYEGSAIDVEIHQAANVISDVELINIKSNTNKIFIQAQGFVTSIHNIRIKYCDVTGISVEDMNSDCIIQDCRFSGISSYRCESTYHKGNVASFINCIFGGVTIGAPTKFENCEIYGIGTTDSIDPDGDNIEFFNCRLKFASVNSSTTLRNPSGYQMEFYDCNIVFEEYTSYQIISSCIFKRCLIDFYDNAYGMYEAEDCEIIVRQLKSTSEYIFYADNLTMYHCLIRILGTKTFTLYRLNRQRGGVYNDLINEGSVVISDVARNKTYGSDNTLYDAGTVYITNHQIA